MRRVLRDMAARHPEKVIWVDSRKRVEHFRRVIVKPNRDEAEAASMRALGRIDYDALRRHMEAPLLVVTHGPDGALVVDERGATRSAARRQEHPIDICGAGDSFSSGAALALRVTGDPLAAAVCGNLVASITIMKKGTGTASPEEALAAASSLAWQ
jgi:sugar/nucleoside kinase (ribokinase family)